MHPVWRWEDRQGGGSWSEKQGYLEMQARNLVKIYGMGQVVIWMRLAYY